MAKINFLTASAATVAAAMLIAVIAAISANSTDVEAAASLGVGITIPPHKINQTAPIQNKTASVNGTNVSIGLPITYNGTGVQNLTLSLPTSWKKVTNIRINESGVIKNVTIVGNEFTFEANLSAPTVTMLFDAAPPSLTATPQFSNSSLFQKNLTIESENSFTNASVSIEVNSSFPFYTLYWHNGTVYVDKTVEFNLKVTSGTATFDSFSTSTVLFRLEGALSCTEIWSCTGWSDARQCGTRTCTDLNKYHCSTTTNKPPESLACPEAAAPAAGGGGGGGRGGGGIARILAKEEAAKKPLLAISPPSAEELIRISVRPGEFKKTSFTLRNIGPDRLSMNIQTEGISNFVSLDTSYVELEPGDSHTVNLLVLADKEAEAGTYSGKIRISGHGEELVINVLIQVTPLKSLFDVLVTVNPKTKSILPGDSVVGSIAIFNLVGAGKFDVKVIYGIKDYSDNLITSKQQTLAVETSASVTGVLDLPNDLKSGSYYMFAVAILDEITVGVGSDTFEVLTPLKIGAEAPVEQNILFIIIMALLLITFMFSSISVSELIRHHLPHRYAAAHGGGVVAVGKPIRALPALTALRAIKHFGQPQPVSSLELDKKLKALEEAFSEGLVSVRAYTEDKVKIENELKKLETEASNQ